MHVSELDEALCSQSRLAIMLALTSHDSLCFMELKQDTGITDGNLHVQTRKLSEMKYILTEKTGSGRKSLTRFRCSDRGHFRLREHLRKLNSAVAPDPETGSGLKRSRRPADDSQVW